jgi:hypothetical protein
MHIREGDLRAFLDNEATESQSEQIRLHLSGCSRCQARLESLAKRANQAAAALDHVPAPKAVSSAAARQRFESYSYDKEKLTMNHRSRNLYPRLAFGLALITLLLGVLAVPQLRAIANNFLGLFRVEQVAVVPIIPSLMEGQMHSSAPQFEQMLASDVEVTRHGQSQDVNSAAEAAQMAGFPLRLPSGLGAPGKLRVEAGMDVEYTIDLPRLRAILAELGQDTTILPESLDQATISAHIPSAVAAVYGDCQTQESTGPDRPHPGIPAGCNTLIQLPSPEVSAPPGLDVDALAMLYLQATGMSEREARRFSERIDWATTLVIPIPADASSQDISVDGVQGVLIQSRYSSYMIIWVKDGVLYAFGGSGKPDAGLELANSLQAP